jgi:hypothetical protein
MTTGRRAEREQRGEEREQAKVQAQVRSLEPPSSKP